jgi:hypothetical protein
MSWLLILALVLACPLMMLWMMRGHRHGGRGGDGDSGTRDTSSGARSTAELRRQRDEVDRLIERRATEEARSMQGGDGHLPLRSGRPGDDR